MIIRRAEKKLDENKHVLLWDLQKNNLDKVDIQNLIPGTEEWKSYQTKVKNLRIAYTAFNTMLKYSHAVANSCYSHNRDDTVIWDLNAQYGYEHTPSRTCELYEDRAKAKAKARTEEARTKNE